jgi:hypothetical protein
MLQNYRKHPGYNKFKYDHMDSKWIDVDFIIFIITMSYNSTNEVYTMGVVRCFVTLQIQAGCSNILSIMSSHAKEALRQETITKSCKRILSMLGEPDQQSREPTNCITARELKRCMWAHKDASESILLLDPEHRQYLEAYQQPMLRNKKTKV